MKTRITTIVMLLVFFFTYGCAVQKTIFRSEPSGAKVYVNGEEVGETPCDYEYKAGVDKEYEVVIAEDGYEPVAKKIETEEVDLKARAKWLAAGIIWSPLWVGTFFTKKLKDGYDFVLKKLRGNEILISSQDLVDKLTINEHYL